jgi:hypothetical protein
MQDCMSAALLDLSLWRGADGGLLVVPRVPMRTVLIERGIVRIETGAARIDPAKATCPVASALIGQASCVDRIRRRVFRSPGHQTARVGGAIASGFV